MRTIALQKKQKKTKKRLAIVRTCERLHSRNHNQDMACTPEKQIKI
jgi:hypothetical protein